MHDRLSTRVTRSSARPVARSIPVRPAKNGSSGRVRRPSGPGAGQFIVAPMVVEPVVRNVVAGRVPLELRAFYVLLASVDLKPGVETPECQLLPDEETFERLLTAPPPLPTARFLPSWEDPVAKKQP